MSLADTSFLKTMYEVLKKDRRRVSFMTQKKTVFIILLLLPFTVALPLVSEERAAAEKVISATPASRETVEAEKAASAAPEPKHEETPPPRKVIPDRHWNESLQVWIARAMVSEAGWEENRDHIAIAYVLYRRWIQAKKKYPKISMIAVITRYCAGFGNIIYSNRQLWVKNLNADASRPRGWPKDLSWRDYRPRWLKVLETTKNWREGLHPDPCRGLSRYWGGPMDRPSRRMIRMDCGDTKNYFYTVKSLLSQNER